MEPRWKWMPFSEATKVTGLCVFRDTILLFRSYKGDGSWRISWHHPTLQKRSQTETTVSWFCTKGIFLNVVRSARDNNISVFSCKICMRTQTYTNSNNNRLVSLNILTRQSIFDVFHLARARATIHTHTHTQMGSYGSTTETDGTITRNSHITYRAHFLKGTRAISQGTA
jgi:hypothetical protein